MYTDIRNITPEVYETDNYVVLDFETDTSHGDYGHPVHPDNGIVLACYKHGPGHPKSQDGDEGKVHAVWADEYGQADLISSIEDADVLVAHNAKYELGWLKRCGVDLADKLVFDTKLAEYVLMGNLAAGDELNPPRGTSLDECCLRRGMPNKDPVVDIMIKHGVNPVNIPRPWLEGRCRQDVESTEVLFHDQRTALRKSGRLGVLLTRCLTTPVLADIEVVGMKLDAERVDAAHKDYSAQLVTLEKEMERITNGLNWKSGPQVAEFLYNDPVSRPKFAEDDVTPVWLVPNAKGRLVEMVEGTEQWHKAYARIEKKIKETHGETQTMVRAMTRPGLGFSELRKHNGEPKRTSSGRKLTDQKTIDALVASTDAQREFVALRKKLGKVSAALTKSLHFFQGVCKNKGGVFHAEINQTKTATHRTSSTGIPLRFVERAGDDPVERSAQFQNLPNAFKPLFCSRGAGRLLAEADGSQLEFRVAAQVSRDSQMVADVLDLEFDAHCTSAAAMYNRVYDELLRLYRSGDDKATKLRKAAKPDTFGPLYGKSRGTPQQMRWIEAFRQRYAGFYEFSEENVYRVLQDKVLVLPWGMRYYWPYAKKNNGDYVNCRTSVYNYPIQGFATAEIIPIALAAFRQLIAEYEKDEYIAPGDIVILNTVHDSIICDIAESALEVWKKIAKQAFTLDVYAYLRNVYNYDFDLVPLGVGMNYGTHWSDPANTEEEWDIFPDGRQVKRK